MGIFETAERLETNPFPKGCRKLQGAEAIYRIRAGQYRVVYQVDEKDRLVTVIHVRHRKDAYRDI
jgi:mRNA interferase RelE/StbE